MAVACRTDSLHSVRVADQYKEILENRSEMCGFFATARLSHSRQKTERKLAGEIGEDLEKFYRFIRAWQQGKVLTHQLLLHAVVLAFRLQPML